MPYVFGPVPSRRLGLSLGIDLIPPKTCTFDCLYCQVGRTTLKTLELKPYVPVRPVLEEVKEKLQKSSPDAITLAGSGEPTLHAKFGRIISGIKKLTDTQVVLLTNGSLLWREEVREQALDADVIMPTLTSAHEKTFRRIHRPHPELKLSNIIEGFITLRRLYRGKIFLEVVLLSGINDTKEELEGIKTVVERICPDRVQLNTVVRPPADTRAMALDRERLEGIKEYFGDRAEIVAAVPAIGKKRRTEALITSVLDMVRRRPLRQVDIANSLGLSQEETNDLIKGLIIKGFIRKQQHVGDTYYLSNENERR